MKRIKLLILAILTVVCSTVLFACATTEADNNNYSERIVLQHNNTEILNSKDGAATTYKVTLLQGGSDYVIKYIVYPSYTTTGGVHVNGVNDDVATYTIDNINQLITLKPSHSFNSENCTQTFEVAANDNVAKVYLEVTLKSTATYGKLPTPTISFNSVNGDYFAVWSDAARAVDHFKCYSVTINGTTTETLTNQCKLNVGENIISVKALSSFKEEKNSEVATDTVTVLAAPKNLKYSYNDKKFTWDAVDGNTGGWYTVTITGDETLHADINNPYYAFTPATNNPYTITVKAKETLTGSDKVFCKSSSKTITLLNIKDAEIKENCIIFKCLGTPTSCILTCEERNASNALIKTYEYTNVASPVSINSLGINFITDNTYTFKIQAVGNNTDVFSSVPVTVGSMKKLAAPTNLRVVEEERITTIKWDAAIGATKYELFKDEERINSVSELSLEYEFTGNCHIKCRALGDGKTTLTSDLISIEVIKLAAPTISLDALNNKITWDAVANGVTYGINVSGAAADDTEYLYFTIPTDLGDGTNEIFVYSKGYVPLDGENKPICYYVSSNNSNVISLQKLAAPTNVRVLFGELCWTPVPNATGYTLSLDGATDYSYEFGSDTTKTALTNIAPGKYTVTIKAVGGDVSGIYYFDSAPKTLDSSIFKLNNNPQIEMDEGNLKFKAGVDLKDSGKTETDIKYSFSLYKTSYAPANKLFDFASVDEVYSQISGGETYVIAVKVSADGLITSNVNENLFSFYKLNNNFEAKVVYDDAGTKTTGEAKTDFARLAFNNITNNQGIIFNVYKETVKQTFTTVMHNEQVDLSRTLTEAGNYTFTLQAKGNSAVAGESAYMTSDVYNVLNEERNTLTITVLDDVQNLSVTNYNVLLGSQFNFNNPLQSSGNIVWDATDSAKGYLVSMQQGAPSDPKDVGNITYLTRENLASYSAGELKIKIRAYGDGKYIISRRNAHEDSFIYTDEKTVVKLEAVSNVYTENNAVYYTTNSSYNNHTINNESHTGTFDIAVEYVVAVSIKNEEGELVNTQYYMTYDFNVISNLLSEFYLTVDDEIKSELSGKIIKLLTSTKFTKLSNNNGIANFVAGDYYLQVYTMPYNAFVSTVLNEDNTQINNFVLSASSDLYITSSASDEYRIHINEKVTGYYFDEEKFKFTPNDVDDAVLSADTEYKFSADILKVAMWDGTKFNFDIIDDATNEYLIKDGESYKFKANKTCYYYQIDINFGAEKTTILVPHQGNNTEIVLNFYDMVKAADGSYKSGSYSLTMKTIIVGKGNRLDSANTETLNKTILSTKIEGVNILQTIDGKLCWQIDENVTKYNLLITDSESNKYNFENIDSEKTYTSTNTLKTINVTKKTIEGKNYYVANLKEFDAGEYTVQITALGDEVNYLDSDISEVFTITKLPEVTGIKVVNGKIWFKVPTVDNNLYTLTIKGGTASDDSYLVSVSKTQATDGEGNPIGDWYYEVSFPKAVVHGTYYISFEANGNSSEGANSGIVTSNPNLYFDGDETDSKLKVTKLAKITGLEVNANGNVSWNTISTSSGYHINLNGREFTISGYTTNELTIEELINQGFNFGECKIIIFAKGGNNNLDSDILAYIDGDYTENASIDIIKLYSLDDYDIKVENGVITWQEIGTNGNFAANFPHSLNVVVTFEIERTPHSHTIIIPKADVLASSFTYVYDDTTYTAYKFDINDYISQNANLNLSDIEYSFIFTNYGGSVDGKNYINSNPTDPLKANKLKNVQNEEKTISVDCELVEGIYQLDKIYFGEFDINSEYYELIINGTTKLTYKCFANISGGEILDTSLTLEDNELQIFKLDTPNKDGYLYYVAYQNKAIEEGNYTISMQAIGNSSYLNSSLVETTEFFVPNAPTVSVETYNATTDTGRIYLTVNNHINKPGNSIEYIIIYKHATMESGLASADIENVSITLTNTDGKITVDNTNALYYVYEDENKNKEQRLYYTFLTAGYYDVKVVCRVNGLPSKESDEVRVRFNFFQAGNGTIADPYQIINLSQLNAISYRPYSHYIFNNNITIDSNYDLSSISFAGTINGNGNILIIGGTGKQRTIYQLFNSIENFSITEEEYDGLSAEVQEKIVVNNLKLANIFNLNIEVVNISYDQNEDFYLLAATNNGYISNVNVTFKQSVQFYKFTAGVGTNNGLIEKVTVKGDSGIKVSANISAGATALTNSGEIINCSNQLCITAQSVGGIACINNNLIQKCCNEAIIEGSYVGGIVSQNASYGRITSCYNTGEIKVVDSEGATRAYAGGIAGELADNEDGETIIEYCYNTGNIAATWNYQMNIGGIVGKLTSIRNEEANETTVQYCYSDCTITVSHDGGSILDDNNYPNITIGGIVGELLDNNNGSAGAIVKYCYANTVLTDADSSGNARLLLGGIASYTTAKIENCYTNATGFKVYGEDDLVVDNGNTSEYKGDVAGFITAAGLEDKFNTDGTLKWQTEV